MKRDHACYGHAPVSDNDLLAFGNATQELGKSSLCMVFFFQAEDGIRDDLVTGVQTCALPILKLKSPSEPVRSTSAIPIRGINSDLPVKFAPNGGAVPGDRIVGIVSPGEGITI